MLVLPADVPQKNIRAYLVSRRPLPLGSLYQVEEKARDPGLPDTEVTEVKPSLVDCEFWTKESHLPTGKTQIGSS